MKTPLKIGDTISWTDSQGKVQTGKLAGIGCVTFYVDQEINGVLRDVKIYQENNPQLVKRGGV